MLLARLAVGALWTAVLAVALYGVDRVALGVGPRGWRPARDLADIPEDAGAVVLPGYLPARFDWPPTIVRYRVLPEPGWWYGISKQGTRTPQVWIGTGEAPVPTALAPGLDACVASDGARCPARWHVLSTHTAGELVWALGAVEPKELKRIVVGLRRTRGP